MNELSRTETPINSITSRLQRLIAVFFLVQCALTWPLWVCPGFPQIPWFSLLTGVPFWVDYVFLAGIVIGALGVIANGTVRGRDIFPGLLYSAAVGLVLFDQHRLQPWTLQLIVSGLLLWWAPNSRGLQCNRWFVCSIYIYSAISKLDLTFLDAHGQLLLNAGLNSFGVETNYWSPESRRWMALLLPVGEMLIGLLLLFRRTRSLGRWASYMMHGLLIWMLGPMGLNHEYGVLGWNLYFILQNRLLFASDVETPQSVEEHVSINPWRGRIAVAMTGLVIGLPIFENWNLYDHWPAWAVYCSRPAKVRVELVPAEGDQIPEEFKDFVTPGPVFSESEELSIDKWSFQTRYCPVYPQLRYRLAVSKALLDRLPTESFQIEIELTPDRWTGVREAVSLSNRQELDEYCERFWINTRPRAAE
ncbi:MauE/DoxX family redox-associated membrane protein [Thalassoglobus sp. JC818]|uniref:MauE/DoxX family redox-associated membrane protein n=1 Tax=Thalassoglobus sp. JC818 TaxID=3232136 RepID=UPI0034589A09